jgi:multidrug efflux pump subunit AcrA (membrane-fusion protein)
MPDPTKPADSVAGDAAGAAGGTTPPKTLEAPKPLSLTQEDLDRIIAERVRRAVPADYEDLKGKAAKYDEAQAASQSELEKAQAKAKRAEEARDAAINAANATLVRAEVLTEASAQGAIDAETVVALLAGSGAITVVDGKVTGVREAVKALLKEKPFLLKSPTPSASGDEFGGNDPKTKAGKIAELEAKARSSTTSTERAAFLKEARALKLS